MEGQEERLVNERRRADVFADWARFGERVLACLLLASLIITNWVGLFSFRHMSGEVQTAARGWQETNGVSKESAQIIHDAADYVHQAGPDIVKGAHNMEVISENASDDLPKDMRALASLLGTVRTGSGSLFTAGTNQVNAIGKAAADELVSLKGVTEAFGTALNSTLLPAIKDIADQTKKSVAAVQGGLLTLMKTTGTSAQALTDLVSDPNWRASLAALEKTMEEIRDGLAKFPAIMEDAKKMADTSAKFRKFILAAQLASILAGIGAVIF
jgi:hypothetical protein